MKMYNCKRGYWLLLILVVSMATSCAPNTVQPEISTETPSIYSHIKGEVSQTNLEAVVEALSSEKFDGRLTGTQGNAEAMAYIVEQFKSIGLENPKGASDYIQPYKQKTLISLSTPELKIMDASGGIVKAFDFQNEFRTVALWRGMNIKGDIEGELLPILALNEITKDNTALEGKILLVDQVLFNENPSGPYDLFSQVQRTGLKVKGIIINRDNRYGEQYVTSTALFYLNDNSQSDDSVIFDNEKGTAMFYCIDSVYQELLLAADAGQKGFMHLDYDYKLVDTGNVIGYIPGSDDTAKNETILITAHLDHVGNNNNGTYHPGALDNGSGVSAMLEIARNIKNSSEQPKKSIVFIAFNGEEESMFGSAAYVSSPLFDLKSSKVINLDMVGSVEPMPLEVISAMKGLKAEFMEIAKELDVEAVDEVEGASDQISFTSRGIDAITLIHMDMTKIHTQLDTLDNYSSENAVDPIRMILLYLDKNAY